MANTNKDILLQRINDLLSKPIYTSLEVYSKGNKIYLLKDSNYRIYILVIPSSPLEKNQKDSLINFGYKEIWENINYEKYINYVDTVSLNQLCDNIKLIFEKVFEVEIERKWRYNLNTGMAVLKDNRTPLLTASERYKKNKKRGILFAFNDFKYTLILTGIIFIGLFSNNQTDSLTIHNVLIVLGLSFIIVKITRLLTILEISSFGKKRFLSKYYSDYFEQYGFKKYGDRYKGQIQGYPAELMFSTLHKYMIIVYHKEISWNRVLKMPTGKAFNRTSYNWTRMFYSQKMIKRRLSKEKIIKEAKDFVELIINQEIEKQHTTYLS